MSVQLLVGGAGVAPLAQAHPLRSWPPGEPLPQQLAGQSLTAPLWLPRPRTSACCQGPSSPPGAQAGQVPGHCLPSASALPAPWTLEPRVQAQCFAKHVTAWPHPRGGAAGASWGALCWSRAVLSPWGHLWREHLRHCEGVCSGVICHLLS